VTFSALASSVATAAGRPAAFIAALAVVLVWAACGPFVGFTNTFYQLTINTGTTIITFLMVFLMQNDASRRDLAQHAKLDALIRASAAPNEYAGIDERLSEDALRQLRAQPGLP
jgi:low affinity Fe/Cu permease